jgi:acyl carrier protein
MQLKSDVRQFIIENFYYGQNDPTLDDHVSFLQNGIIDSTGVLELVSFIQEKYQIRILDDELVPENLDSLHNIEVYVTAKLGKELGADAAHAR